jgi:hypothetical protein
LRSGPSFARARFAPIPEGSHTPGVQTGIADDTSRRFSAASGGASEGIAAAGISWPGNALPALAPPVVKSEVPYGGSNPLERP